VSRRWSGWHTRCAKRSRARLVERRDVRFARIATWDNGLTSFEQQLVEEIAAAFDGVGREGGVSLHEAEEIDCHGTPEKRAEARKLDIDTRWQDVRDEWIEQFPSVPFFLDARGFRYYLPAYMIWALRNPNSESAAEDAVVDNLLLDEKVSELLPLLTDQQKQVICRWLRNVEKGYYDPERRAGRAIDALWGRYCGKDSA
jgi:hypothetical protein